MLRESRRCSPVAVLRIALLVWLVAASGAAPVAADDYSQNGQPPLPVVTLTIGDATLLTELAVSGEQRYRGLGNRRTLDRDAAMLFVYEQPRMLTFTMRDTRLPLSIAFLSDAEPGAGDPLPGAALLGRTLVINEIIDMDVGPGQFFPSTQQARYALEVNQGWFDDHGIEPGDRVRIAPDTLR